MTSSIVETMNQSTSLLKTRATNLKDLLSKPFDLKNQEQIKALQDYMDEFELLTHQYHYSKQASRGHMISLVWSMFGNCIPFGIVLSPLMNTLFYLTSTSYLLTTAPNDDLLAMRLIEMQDIYTWILKGSKIDSTELLAHQDIRRLVELMAPWCEVDFMVSWERVIREEHDKAPEPSYWSIATSYLPFFSAPPVDLEGINNLKRNVELRAFDQTQAEAFKKACEYFKDHPKLRAGIEYVSNTGKQAKEVAVTAFDYLTTSSQKKLQ